MSVAVTEWIFCVEVYRDLEIQLCRWGCFSEEVVEVNAGILGRPWNPRLLGIRGLGQGTICLTGLPSPAPAGEAARFLRTARRPTCSSFHRQPAIQAPSCGPS